MIRRRVRFPRLPTLVIALVCTAVALASTRAGEKVSARLRALPSAAPHERVEIWCPRGRVVVGPSASGRIEVDGVQIVESSSVERSDEMLSQLLLRADSDSSAGLWRLTVEPPRIRRRGILDAFLGRRESHEVELRVRLPVRTQVSVRGQTTNVTVEDMRAPVQVGTQAGDVILERLEGEVGVVAHGNVRLADVLGAGRIEGGNGTVEVIRMVGPLEIETRSGNVDVSDVTGPLVVRSWSGSLRAQDCKGGLRFSSASGRAVLDRTTGHVDLQTASGNLDLGVQPRLGDNYDLRTSSGRVVVRIQGESEVRVDAFTAGGRLDASLPGFVVVKRTEREVRSYRGGATGPVLSVRSSGGDVEILVQGPAGR